MWGRSVAMLMVLLAVLGVAIEWLVDRHAILPLDARAVAGKARHAVDPPAPGAIELAHTGIAGADAALDVDRTPDTGADAHPADATLPQARIDAAIRDLHDDDVPGNARAALQLLRSEPAAVPALRRALRSPDLQQRQLAALVLRSEDAAPDADLVRVSFEALDDEVIRAMVPVLGSSVARSVLPYLYRHPESCVREARPLLWRDAAGDRLLGAFVLACAQDTADLGTVVRILTSHLADNQIGGDALLAAHGLYKLGATGPPILPPLLRDARQRADDQARGLLDLILEDLRNPPRSRADLHRRRAMHDVTTIYHDPAVEYVVGRMSVLGF